MAEPKAEVFTLDYQFNYFLEARYDYPERLTQQERQRLYKLFVSAMYQCIYLFTEGIHKVPEHLAMDYIARLHEETENYFKTKLNT